MSPAVIGWKTVIKSIWFFLTIISSSVGLIWLKRQATVLGNYPYYKANNKAEFDESEVNFTKTVVSFAFSKDL